MTGTQETATTRPDLPELPLEAWEPTKTTLHLWAQIVGKIKLAATTPATTGGTCPCTWTCVA
jgi:hypothetical protein